MKLSKKEAVKKIALPLITYKIFIIIFIILASQLIAADNIPQFKMNFPWPNYDKMTIADHFKTWDGEQYLFLTEHGYQKSGFASNAFYPLWPAIIWLFSNLIIGNHLMSAIVLSIAFSTIGMCLFFYFVNKRHGKEIATIATLLLLAYPGSMFFNFPYTESLFFLLVVLFFIFMYEKNYVALSIVSFLLPLTRAVGLFCIFPLAYKLWSSKEPIKKYLLLTTPFLGFLVYLLIIYIFTGNPFDGFQVQNQFASGASIGKIFHLKEFLSNLLGPISNLHYFINSPIDRLFFLLFLPFLYPIYKLDKTYFVYSLFLGVLPAMTSSFMSYTRYLTMVFPLFIVGAIMLQRKQKVWTWLILTMLFSIQIIFLLMHIYSYWVG